MTEQRPSNYDLLYRLTLRLLDMRHRYSLAFPRGGPTGTPQLFIGTLPPSLDVELPIPGEGEIIGTVQMGTHCEIVLDVGRSTKSILKFYEDHLGASGWTAYHTAGNQWNGFQHHTQPDVAFGQFDRGPQGPALNVRAIADGDSTDLCLYLNTEPAPPPRPYLGDHRPRPQDSCIPGLAAPPRTTVEPQGGEFGLERAECSAIIGTELDAAAIQERYATQLRDAGWNLVDEDNRDGATTTAWQFTYRSHQYAASMSITETSAGQYVGQIQAEQNSSQPDA